MQGGPYPQSNELLHSLIRRPLPCIRASCRSSFHPAKFSVHLLPSPSLSGARQIDGPSLQTARSRLDRQCHIGIHPLPPVPPSSQFLPYFRLKSAERLSLCLNGLPQLKCARLTLPEKRSAYFCRILFPLVVQINYSTVPTSTICYLLPIY